MSTSRPSLAAQVAAQVRPVSVTPIRPVVLPPSTAPVTVGDTFQRFSALVQTHRRTAGELAYLAYRLESANEWQALGFSDVEGMCDALGITEQWWKRCVLLGERLQHLTLTEIQTLSSAAMDSLTRVHPSLWNEYAWVEEAKVLQPKEFRMLVSQRNEQVTKSQLSEPRTQLMLRVPLSQHPVLERRLEMIRKQERLGSTAEALTFALASVDRADLMTDTLTEIQRQVAELSRIQESLRELPSEKDARLDGDKGQVAARIRAQKLTAQIMRTIGDVCASSEEEIQDADTGAAIQAV